MKKTYILDTNILLDDPNSLHVFDDCNVVIPFIVIEELDRHKDRKDICGANARDVARKISEYIKDKNNELTSGIKLYNNSTLYVLSFADLNTYKSHDFKDIIDFEDNKKGDNLIIDFVRKLSYEPKFKHPVLVTRDVLLRIKCNSLDIPSEDYKRDAAIRRDEKFYTGVARNVPISYELIQTLYHDYDRKELVLSAEELKSQHGESVLRDYCIYPNTYVIFVSEDEKAIGPFRYDSKQNGFVKLLEPKITNYSTRNLEQRMALDMLMNPEVVLCSITGRAGSGKTLLSIASGLEQLNMTMPGTKTNKRNRGQKYDSLVITKPVIDIGEQAIGFLPGNLEEKMSNWLLPFKDNLRYLISKGKKDAETERTLQYYFESGLIEVAPITFMRGRSIANAFIIIDECLPYEQKILTENGMMSIGKMYYLFKNNKEIPLVKSWNEDKKIFEYKKVTHAWNKGKKSIIELKFSNRKVQCTENHKFLTSEGYKPASMLQLGDFILSDNPEQFQISYAPSKEQMSIMAGLYLGDGSLQKIGKNRYRIKCIHGEKQKEYIEWQSSFFQNTKIKLIEKNGYSHKKAYEFLTKTYAVNSNLINETKKQLDSWVIENFDEKCLAVWCMDDGTLSRKNNSYCLWTCSFTKETNFQLISLLKTKFGIEAKHHEYFNKKKNKTYHYIKLNASEVKKLSKLIAPFVHPSMSYKVLPEHRSLCNLNNWNYEKNNFGYCVLDKITNLKTKKDVYDIEVEDNHNFIVTNKRGTGGVIVHNCQNLTLHEIKTILTRVGENSKIVILGDIDQIDSLHLDKLTNGLTNAIEKFKESDLAAHVSLEKGERSALATEAARLL